MSELVLNTNLLYMVTCPMDDSGIRYTIGCYTRGSNGLYWYITI